MIHRQKKKFHISGAQIFFFCILKCWQFFKNLAIHCASHSVNSFSFHTMRSFCPQLHVSSKPSKLIEHSLCDYVRMIYRHLESIQAVKRESSSVCSHALNAPVVSALIFLNCPEHMFHQSSWHTYAVATRKYEESLQIGEHS